jgi:hypothetical protein
MNEYWIPVVLFIVIGFTTAAYFYWNNRNRVAIMDTVQKAMDNGKELTPELLIQMGAAVNPRARDLRRGIVIFSIGVATLLCSLFFADPDVVSGLRAGSMFPLMMGAGFLLVWKLNSKEG